MTNLYHVPLNFNAALTSALMNEKLGQLDESIFNLISGETAIRQFNFGTGEGAGVALTIASDAITISRGHHTVDVQSGTTDNLSTINGGGAGDELILRLPTGSTNVITVKHGTGNIFLSSLGDIIMDSPNRTLRLFYNGTYWTDANFGLSTQRVIRPRTALSVAAAEIVIASIPNYYSYLELLLELRTANNATNIQLQFNDDTTVGNYSSSFAGSLENLGNVAFYTASASTFIQLNGIPSGGADTGLLSWLRVQIPRYAITGQKRYVYAYGPGITGSAFSPSFHQNAGFWTNTAAAISKIKLITSDGTNFAAGSAYTLYGFL